MCSNEKGHYQSGTNSNKFKHLCALCGHPMPKGEEMFKYHGYSGDCPNVLPVKIKREIVIKPTFE